MARFQTISLIIIVLILSTAVKAQWKEVTNLPYNFSAWAIDASDSLTAAGPCTANSLYITTNGGTRWETIFRPSSINDISIIDSERIWICNDAGEIWATTDAGTNWNLQFYNQQQTNFMNYIEMFDSMNGVAMGDAPSYDKPALFLRTTNGGADWRSMNDSSLIGLWSGDTWREVDFIDLNIGYFYSYRENPEKLYKTTNGGKDWIALNKNLGCQIIKFYNEDIGILKSGICSDTACYSQIYRTIDGGLTWKAVGTDSLDWGLDIEFIPNNPAKVWLLAGNKVLFSNDTGKTWNEEIYKPDFHTRSGFIDIEFTDSNHGWLIGREQTLPFRQHLYKTVNGGHGGIMNIKAASRLIHDYYLSNNYPNPFNPSTKITFRIPTAEHVEMTVYDLLGREVATLVNGFKNAGNYTVDFYASKLASGVYLYRIKSGDFILSKKMVLLK